MASKVFKQPVASVKPSVSTAGAARAPGSSPAPAKPPAPGGAPNRPFFRRIDWVAAGLTFLTSLAVYAATQAPTVTLEDSGELVVAADYLGVPHPPGYPIWTILAWIFQWLFHWVSYNQHPNPAWGVAFMSGFFGALTCALVTLLISRSGIDLLRLRRQETGGEQPTALENAICAVSGMAGGMMLAFTALFWSQCLIAEVYSLNAFFHIAILVLAYVWFREPKREAPLYLMAFVFGVGFTDCQPIVLLLPALMVLIADRDKNLFWDWLAVGSWLLAGFLYFKVSEPELSGGGAVPHKDLWVTMGVLLLLTPLGILLVRRRLFTEWRRLLLMALCAGLGLAFFIYMPIASDQNPPMNWGYPRTWEGFKHAVTRGQYQALSPALRPNDFFNQTLFFFIELGKNDFPIPLVFLPLIMLPFLKRQSVGLLVMSVSLFAVLYAVGGVVEGVFHAGWIRAPDGTIKPPEESVPILTIVDGAVIVAWVLIAIYVFYKLFPGDDFNWLASLGIAFSFLGGGMMIILNPAHDEQAMFIAKVQFVQADTVFALWIGYGLLLGLVFLEQHIRSKPAMVALLGAVLISPASLLWLNFKDQNLHGHDFGWQFGYYQLRGANGIREELRAGEPPLPDPAFPPEMTTNAVFFGGTDPGRFVPTYMIYSGGCRSDVMLITQNALADNTYMNVMRDLYGDLIWMPTPYDCNQAFQQYVTDVRAGRIPPNAAVHIDANGRVSVQGVQGVMEINGIICKLIFEKNKAQHDFYVEESYVIGWMYPYLEPHGLIMKINKEPLPGLNAEIVKHDMEFWRWYGDRLLRDPKFQTDEVARKTFSKLRCAIAGLYGYRRMFPEAESAFKQAVELFPTSPEANFRLADLYLQYGQFTNAYTIMAENLRLDPGNDKIAGFMNQIKELEKMNGRMQELQYLLSSGKGSLEHALELLVLFQRTGKEGPFQEMFRQLLSTTNLPPQVHLELAKICATGAPPRLELMRDAFQTYLARQPSDPAIWVELAAVQLALNQGDAAMQALRQAVGCGGEPIKEKIRGDQRFEPLRRFQEFARLVEPRAQGLPLFPGGFIP